MLHLWPRSTTAVAFAAASDVLFIASVAVGSVAHLLEDASTALRKVASA